VSSQPEIPDAISADALTSLLGQRRGAPASSVIPELDLGGTLGAPCDLQFVISQLIARSATGTNLVQMLVAGMHLLTEAESHFAEQLERLATAQPPFDRANSDEQHMVRRLLTAHIHHVQLAIAQLEPLLQAVSVPMYQARTRQLMEGPYQGQTGIPLPELRSHLLISDELIASLGLERSAITAYLNRQASDD
jgi:hypothetical protein